MLIVLLLHTYAVLHAAHIPLLWLVLCLIINLVLLVLLLLLLLLLSHTSHKLRLDTQATAVAVVRVLWLLLVLGLLRWMALLLVRVGHRQRARGMSAHVRGRVGMRSR